MPRGERAELFDAYLVGLAGRYPEAQLATLRRLWSEAEHAAPGLFAPRAAPNDDTFAILWERGRYHAALDVLPDGSWEWFFTILGDHMWEDAEGLAASEPMPPTFRERLREIAATVNAAQ